VRCRPRPLPAGRQFHYSNPGFALLGALAGHLRGSMPGFLATLWVSPSDGLGAVTLSNATAGPAIGEIAADLIYYTGETLRLVPAADGVGEHLDLGTFVFTREPYGPGSPLAARPHEDGWQAG
jgi:hypothetical protein